MKLLNALVLISLLFGCSKKLDPDTIIEEYSRALIKGDSVEKFLTKNFEIDKNENVDFSLFRNVKVKNLSKNCIQEEKCNVTYLISYSIVDEKGQKVDEVETKKIASIVKNEEEWKIDSVTEIKTYLEGQKEIQVKP